MQAKTKRILKSGQQYERFIPKARGRTRQLVGEGAGLNDTLRELPELIRKNTSETHKIAQVLRSESLSETARNIYDFLYEHIQYEPDKKNTEQVRSFARMWADRKGDCDCYTNTISAILLNLGISHSLRIAKYQGPKFQHIYVIVPKKTGGYLTIDPVLDRFDFEVPFTDHIDIPMTLEHLDGFGLQGPSTTKGKAADGIAIREAARLGISVDEYKRRELQKWIAQTGMTPEEFDRKVRAQVAQGQSANAARRNAEMEAMRQELTRRKVPIPPNATHQDLLRLLNANPARNLGAKVVNAVNKVNPGALALRTGLLLAMKNNSFKIAERIRYGLLTQSQAQARKLNLTRWGGIRKALGKLLQMHFVAGGNKDKLKAAILKGKGNRDGFVPVPEGLSGMEGELGEVTLAVAMAAAAAALKIIGAILAKIGDARQNGESGMSTAGEILTTVSEGGKEVMDIIDYGPLPSGPEVIRPQIPDLLPGSLPQHELPPFPEGPVTHLPGQEAELIESTEAEEPQEPGFLAKHGLKLLAALGLTGGLIWMGTNSKPANLSGSPKRKASKAKPSSRKPRKKRPRTATKKGPIKVVQVPFS